MRKELRKKSGTGIILIRLFTEKDRNIIIFCSLCIVASIRIVAQEVKTDEATGEQIYILKDGYTLILTDVLEQGNHVYKVFLKKGNEIFLVSSGQYFNNAKYFPRYEGIDFNDCFVLAFFMGDYNYVLYDKDTHVPVLDFYLGGYDISNNLLIYWEKESSIPGYAAAARVFLLDLQNKRKYQLNSYLADFQKNQTVSYLLHFHNQFEIMQVSDTAVEILYTGFYDYHNENQEVKCRFSVKRDISS